jgi:DNA-binding NarL/FixJ family response regulator
MNPSDDPACSDDLTQARKIRDAFMQPSPAFVAFLAALKGEAPPFSPPRVKRRKPQPTAAGSEADNDLRFALAIVVAYCNGVTQQQIATTHGIHVQTVRTILREVGVKVGTHNSTFTEEEFQAISP